MSQTARRLRLLKSRTADLTAQSWGNLGDLEMTRSYRSTGRRHSPDSQTGYTHSTGRRHSPDSQTGYTHSTDPRLPLEVDPERTTWGDWLLRAIIVVPTVAYCAYAMGWLG